MPEIFAKMNVKQAVKAPIKQSLNQRLFYWCRGAESNRLRKDFQSFALPMSYLGKKKWFFILSFDESFIISSILSFPEVLFFFVKPHFWHLQVTLYLFFIISMLTGSIIPLHSDARSPGFMSTCFDQRHRGQ